METHRSLGQAVLEYLIVLTFIGFVGVNLLRGVGKVAEETMGSLSYVLSQHLSVGVCQSLCYFENFENRVNQ